MIRIHLDTDFGGDPDDACALAMLLGWRGAELVGVTTTIDPGGRRAWQVAQCLRLAGRNDVPVAAGAGVSLTTLRVAEPLPDDRYPWPPPPPLRPLLPGAALDLLQRSIEHGAAIVAIGPLTNLALLEVTRPGTLGRVGVTIMGGWIDPPATGLPAWGPEHDFNLQWDTRAAEIVAATANQLTLATLPATLTAHLRAGDIPRLRASGRLGELLARLSQAHAVDREMAALGRAHAALPDDLLNFHYDPVAGAVALGWPGAVIEPMRLRLASENANVRFQRDPSGRPLRVVTHVDGERFRETWLSAIEAAQR